MGFALLELRKLFLCETCDDKLQAYSGEKNKRLHYMDTDSFVLSLINNIIIRDLQGLNEIFDIRISNRNPELYSLKNERVFGKFKTKTPRNVFQMNIFL